MITKMYHSKNSSSESTIDKAIYDYIPNLSDPKYSDRSRKNRKIRRTTQQQPATLPIRPISIYQRSLGRQQHNAAHSLAL